MNEICTFNYLKSISPALKTRYRQVEFNLMVSSYSYYDSLGNLLENYLKYVAKIKNIKVESEDSHGKLFSKLSVFVLEELSFNRNKFYSMRNLSRQINSHKHYQPLNMEKNKAIAELHGFFDLYAKVSLHELSSFTEYFDIEHFNQIYGIYSPKAQIELFISIRNNMKDSVKGIEDKSDSLSKKLSIFQSLLEIKSK